MTKFGKRDTIGRRWTWTASDSKPETRTVYKDGTGFYCYVGAGSGKKRVQLTDGRVHGNQFVYFEKV